MDIPTELFSLSAVFFALLSLVATRKAIKMQDLVNPRDCICQDTPTIHDKRYPSVTTRRLDIKAGSDKCLLYIFPTENVEILV